MSSVNQSCANVIKKLKQNLDVLNDYKKNNDEWGKGYNIGYDSCIGDMEHILEQIKGSDKKDRECSCCNGSGCKACDASKHKKDCVNVLSDETEPCDCKGSDKKDEVKEFWMCTDKDCEVCKDTHKKDEIGCNKKFAYSNNKNSWLTCGLFALCPNCLTTHKKDYRNVALSEKLMTGLTEKQYDKAVKE